MISFSGRHYPSYIILQCVRWYVSYALSYRNIEEMMNERGFEIDHATLKRWDALQTFIHDGTVEIDNNIAERAMRPIALGRNNYLFAGSDRGGETAATFTP